MNNVLRTLVLDDEVSLTLADTTVLVREGIARHGLRGEAAVVFGRALSFVAYTSSCLKESSGELSVAFRTNGKLFNLGASGNAELHIRGYLDWNASAETLLNDGSITVVRDDGYNRPFVGACATFEGELDENFEEYYRVSEQLPTKIKTRVLLDGEGEVEFAGVAVLQPLPFASEKTLSVLDDEKLLSRLLAEMSAKGIEAAAKSEFGVDEKTLSLREANYRCNCSREYLASVLVSLGKAQFSQIIEEEGEVRAHCHYCNQDYVFTKDDEKILFP